MKFRKEYIILLVIIIALSSYIFSRSKNRTNYELPEIAEIQKSEVSKIKIKRPGEKVILEKSGELWNLLPEVYPADKNKIENMLNKASGITLTALASESKNYAVYDLDEKKRIEVELFKEEQLLRKIFIGKPVSSGRHTFIQIADDYRVYHADGNLKNVFNKNIADLRDKKTLKINDDIVKVTLIDGKKELRLFKNPVDTVKETPSEKEDKKKTQPSYSWQTEKGRDVPDGTVNEIINMLRDFECDEFINDKKKEDFKSPSYKVILSGAEDYSISFFNEKNGKFEAVSSQNDYPFLVSEWRAKRIMKDFDEVLGKKKD